MLEIALRPGISYELSDKISALAKLGSLGYMEAKEKDSDMKITRFGLDVDTYNLLFYVAVQAYFKEIGKMDAFLFVSDYKDKEWEYDRQDLKRGQAMAYVHNYDVPMFSELGLIGIKPTIAAGLQRIW